MKLSMWKLSTALILGASTLFGASDKAIEDFIKGNVARNPNVTLLGMEVTGRSPVEGLKGWEAVKLKLKLEVNRGGKKNTIDTTDILFTSGDVVANDLYHLTKKQSLKNMVRPDVKPEHYRSDRIIAGDKSGKAKYKIVVFSDPQCPFCMDYVPDVIALTKKHPEKISLYYYHLPLPTLHPAAPTIVRAVTALELKGEKDVVERMYAADMESRSTDEAEVLAEFNKKMKCSLKPADLHTKEIDEHVALDASTAADLMVRGTPSIFINGEFDNDKSMFENLKKTLK